MTLQAPLGEKEWLTENKEEGAGAPAEKGQS